MLDRTRKAISDAATAVYEIKEHAAMCSTGERVALTVHNLLVDASECDDLDDAENLVDEANDLAHAEYGKLHRTSPEHYDMKTLGPLGAVTMRLAQSLGYAVAYGEV